MRAFFISLLFFTHDHDFQQASRKPQKIILKAAHAKPRPAATPHFGATTT
ncbi:hypothetical protein CAter282_1540 [Collimonas arenae]|uniref:Uncharacterized protein n=1 Tax=Collimonas arenae TaxID=279058 RepID=A0A127PNR5_9BURK|nr:hypothetical protein CAter10_1666 [Collimonas arenae]AMP09326.1 hypothetical protein CAter282_1540 [Collimonas arenae]